MAVYILERMQFSGLVNKRHTAHTGKQEKQDSKDNSLLIRFWLTIIADTENMCTHYAWVTYYLTTGELEFITRYVTMVWRLSCHMYTMVRSQVIFRAL